MTGRHIAIDMPEIDRLVDDACAGIGAEIEAAGIPVLSGVVLGGGYGRGEGGVKDGGLSNDLDFFAITEEGASYAGIAGVAAALEPVAREWTAKLGVDVDFTVRTPWRMRHDEKRLMVQELLRGYFDVAGRRGEELFAGIARLPAEDVPWSEAARLMMNRGMGLLLAGESEDRMFAARNLNKCILGAGDARLVARRSYRWAAVSRAEELGDRLYRAALDWKFRPSDAPVCDAETAREAWLAAFDEVMEAGKSAGALGRSPREAARWIWRRRTLGEIAGIGQDCELRVLKGVARSIRGKVPLSQELKRDWEIFN